MVYQSDSNSKIMSSKDRTDHVELIGILNRAKEVTMNIVEVLSTSLVSTTTTTTGINGDGGRAEYSRTLAAEIVGLFDSSINACARSTKPRILVAIASTGARDDQDSGLHKKRKTAIGCNNVVEEITNWKMMAPITYDDGYSWRKYGQKEIFNRKFPKSYYRCSHKHEGCEARKQVQVLDTDRTQVEITYKGKHTCRRPASTMTIIKEEEDPYHLNPKEIMLNFQSPSSTTTLMTHYSQTTYNCITPNYKHDDVDVKEEIANCELSQSNCMVMSQFSSEVCNRSSIESPESVTDNCLTTEGNWETEDGYMSFFEGDHWDVEGVFS